MSKHSPTPWQYGHTDTPLGAQIVDGDGEAVACTSMRSGLGKPDPERKANGEHIVHCVNMHDDLVAAIKTAKEILFAEARCGSSAASDASMILADALAKAGEE